jgi:hypothetical protein
VWPLGSGSALTLTHVVTTRLSRADRGLARLDLVDVDDLFLSVAADAKHGEAPEGDYGSSQGPLHRLVEHRLPFSFANCSSSWLDARPLS